MHCRLTVVMTLLLLPACAPRDQTPPQEQALKPDIAASKGVEITLIRITRERSSGDEADVTKMELNLWLPTGGRLAPTSQLVQVVELEPIEDNTGRLLSNKERLQCLPFMSEEIVSQHVRNADGKTGPQLDFVLEAPARQATSI